MIKLKIVAKDGEDLRSQLIALLGDGTVRVESSQLVSRISGTDIIAGMKGNTEEVIPIEPKKTRTRTKKAETSEESTEDLEKLKDVEAGEDTEDYSAESKMDDPEVKVETKGKKPTIDDIRQAVMDCRNIPAQREASKELVEKYCGKLEPKVSNIPESSYANFLADIQKI